jgi:integrase
MAQIVTLRQENPLSWKDRLNLFILTLKAQGKAPRTIRDYSYQIGVFFTRFPDALESHEKGKLAALAFLADDSIGPVTFNHRLRHVRTFFQWLIGEGHVAQNPFDGFKKRREPGRLVDVDMDTITALLDLPDRATWTGKRDYALMLFSVDTATRPGEALQLQPADFDLPRAEVTIPAHVAKTRTPRTLPMSAQTVKAIREFIDARHPSWKMSVPVFCSQDGTRMQENSWGMRFRNTYAHRLGKPISPYSLRHAAATLLLRSGANAFAVQALLGHTTPYMTQRYVHLVSSDLKDQHARFSPIGQIVGERQRVGRKA